jgi:hypothetical protein
VPKCWQPAGRRVESPAEVNKMRGQLEFESMVKRPGVVVAGGEASARKLRGRVVSLYRKGWKQASVAKRLEVSQATVCRIIRQAANGSAERIRPRRSQRA